MPINVLALDYNRGRNDGSVSVRWLLVHVCNVISRTTPRSLRCHNKKDNSKILSMCEIWQITHKLKSSVFILDWQLFSRKQLEITLRRPEC